MGDVSPDGTDRQVLGERHRQSVASDITRVVVQLMARYTGRGPTKASSVYTRSVIIVTLRDTLTQGEHTLVEVGQAESVMRMRRAYHDAMRDEAAEQVEAITGRRVIATLGDIAPDANLAAIVFVLDEDAEPGQVT